MSNIDLRETSKGCSLFGADEETACRLPLEPDRGFGRGDLLLPGKELRWAVRGHKGTL